MTRQIQARGGIPRGGRTKNAADVVGDGDTPLDVLLRMMNAANTSDRDRADIARICLPFVHPRIEPLGLLEAPVDEKSRDLTDPMYQWSIIRHLAFAFSSTLHAGKTLPESFQDLIKAMSEAARSLPQSPK